MTDPDIAILDGPDKPALQWAVAYPDRERVHFKLQGDAIDAQIARMDELPDGFSFRLQGVIISGSAKGRSFQASYSVETRSGSLSLDP